MRSIILGLVATAAIASPLALATSANADIVSTDANCTPVKHVDAWTETLYKYTPVKVSEGPTQWDTKNAPANTAKTWSVKGKTVAYFRDGTKTSTVNHAAIEGVICSVTLPTAFEGEGTYSVVVPFTKGVDTFIIGAQGYDEHTPITKDSVVTKADANQFWVGHKAQPGYVIANPAVGNNDRTLAQWHIDFQFATGPNEIRFSDPSGLHITLPDVFDIEHTEYAEGPYWSTQVKVTVTNDTDTDREFRVRYQDVQDGDRVWVERAIFTDGLPGNVVPAHSSRVMTLDVWHNVVSGADVPDDLTLDLGYELG